MKWDPPNGMAFSYLTKGSLIPYVLIFQTRRLSNPMRAWESGGFQGSGIPTRRWVAKIAPPCLRNRLLPKSFHLALGLLGVTDLVPIDLEDIDARDGQILENRVDQQGGAEVSPLLVELLLSHILSSSCSHGFLRSVEITQERRSGGGREICHKLCGCGYVADM